MVQIPCFYCTLSYTISYHNYSPVQAITARATIAAIIPPCTASTACKGVSGAFYGYAVQYIYIIVLRAQWNISRIRMWGK